MQNVALLMVISSIFFKDRWFRTKFALREKKKLSERQDENECFNTRQPQNIFNN